MNNIIKSLNLNEGEVLTLEKLSDRMEFEAFSAVAGMDKGGDDVCGFYTPCLIKDPCPEFSVIPCDCDGPVGYINCRPYRG